MIGRLKADKKMLFMAIDCFPPFGHVFKLLWTVDHLDFILIKLILDSFFQKTTKTAMCLAKVFINRKSSAHVFV